MQPRQNSVLGRFMGKKDNLDNNKRHNAISTTVEKHLEKSRLLLHKRVQLEENKNKIASIWILLIACTLVPYAIFLLLRYFIDFKGPSMSSIYDATKLEIEESIYGPNYALIRQELDVQLLKFNEAITILAPVIVTFAPFFDSNLPRSNKLMQIASGISQLDAHPEQTGRILAGHMDEIIAAFKARYPSFKMKFDVDKGSLSSQIDKNLKETDSFDTVSSMIRGISSVYSIYISQLDATMSLIPRALKINVLLTGTELPEIDFIDFNTHTLNLERLSELPTLALLSDLITVFKKMLEKIDQTLPEVLEPLTTNLSKSLFDQLNSAAKALAYRYSVLLTIVTTVFIHRFGTTRMIQSLWPLQYYTSNLPDKKINNIADISSFQLTSLNQQLDRALKDTDHAAQRNSYIAKIMNGLLLALATALYSNTHNVLILNLAIPYLIGVLIDKALDYGLASHTKRSLTQKLKQGRVQLKEVFPSIAITTYKNERMEDSCFVLTVDQEPVSFSKLEYSHLVESVLEKFAFSTYTSYPEQGKLLIAVNHAFPVAKMAVYFQQLLQQMKVMKELTLLFADIFKNVHPSRYCYHKIVYDDNELPLFQFIVNRDVSIKIKDILLKHRFQTLPDQTLIFQTSKPLENSEIENLKLQLKNCHAEENRSATYDKPPAIEKRQTGRVVTDDAPTQPRDPQKTEKIQRSNPADPSHKTYTWTNVAGEDITSDDPRIKRIEGHAGSAYVFFKLTLQDCHNDQTTYNKFSEAATFIAKTRIGAQGIKWYAKDTKPKTHPDGSVGRVKLISKKLGDVGLFLYRQPLSKPDQPLLYYTDNALHFGIHK